MGMNRQMMLSLVGIGAALLGGCNSEPDRSEDYYREHRNEARAKHTECQAQAKAKSMASDNCARAKKVLLENQPVKNTTLPPVPTRTTAPN